MRKVPLSVTDSGFCVATSTKFTVAIYTDAAVRTQIGNGNCYCSCCTLFVGSSQFRSRSCFTHSGNDYWVVVTTSTAPTQIGTTAVWWEANVADAPFNLNDGNGWVVSLRWPGRFS